MRKIFHAGPLTLIVVIAACQHEPQTVAVPQTVDYQTLYLEAKAQLDAAQLIAAERNQARDEFMQQLQIQYWKDSIQNLEWMRNTGARMHRPRP